MSKNTHLPNAEQQVAGHSGIQRDAALEALVTAVRQVHGDAVDAVLFYGSCLRSGDPAAGIADFYVLVSSYRKSGMSTFSAAMNWLLPPNVFYLETPLAGHTLRAKYAIVRTDQFIRGASGAWFLPYLWGRFAQPSRIPWAANNELKQTLEQTLERARLVFLRRVSVCLSGTYSTAKLWQTALLMSYKTELRAERLEKIRSLIQAEPRYYAEVTLPCLERLSWYQALESDSSAQDQNGAPIKADADDMELQQFILQPSLGQRLSGRVLWSLRQLLGKLVSIFRLFKSLFTFSGAVDYAAWKIERHSGQPVEIPDWVRRYPWIGAWPVLWRLWRKGQLR